MHRWKDLAYVQTHSNLLWKLAAVLIDVLWQPTLPQRWCISLAVSAVSCPLLYWLSHWSSLWSTQRKETSLASHARIHTHTHTCSAFVSLLSHTVSHLCICLSTYSQTTLKCRSLDSLLRQRTHAAWSYNTKLYCVAAVTSVLYGQLYQGHWSHVGIGFDFIHKFKAHKCVCIHIVLVLECYYVFAHSYGRDRQYLWLLRWDLIICHLSIICVVAVNTHTSILLQIFRFISTFSNQYV